ncbi:MAG: DUF1572 family protein [Gemmatimonadales bacterium]
MPDDSSLIRDSLKMMLQRELRSTEQSIASYPDDESLWIVKPGISNSGGNLALHMAGNLRHFIGGVLGKSGYTRDRDAEFGNKSMTRDEIRAVLESSITEIGDTLDNMDASQFSEDFPIPIGQSQTVARTSDMLVHLAAHLGYHLGQLDYHRRLLTAEPKKLDTLSVTTLGR